MSLFQSNLRKQIRNLPKILNLKFVKIIHYFSKLFTGVLGGDDLVFITSLDGAGVQSDCSSQCSDWSNCCNLDNVVDQDPATGDVSMVAESGRRPSGAAS